MRTFRPIRHVSASLLVVSALSIYPTIASAQTNATKVSSVGTWKLDIQKSDLGADPKPQAVTLTILRDAPEMISWRVDSIEDAKNESSFSWSGPKDGSMRQFKDDKGQPLGLQSVRDDNGVVVRHIESPDGSTADGRATMSADGNTITDEVMVKAKDGPITKLRFVWVRSSSGKSR